MGAACRKACSGKPKAPAAGSVLDQVISQASADDPTVLYKLANYKKGGLLVEEYTRGGQVAAEQFIRERLAAYMYARGAGQAINRAEYLRWKFRDQEHDIPAVDYFELMITLTVFNIQNQFKVVLPIEASLSRHDPLARWSDHDACWQMRYRGALGESLLHLLIICDTRIHTRLARTLLKCFPRLSLDVVEGEEYLGASSLHLAIAYSNNELVQDLIEAGADVSQRAIGSFFLPRDQQTNPPSRRTDYEGLAYLGEYPLAWAACCANEAVYNLLLDSGADPDMADTFGNMILHMVVVCDKLDMFGYALRHPKMPASNGRMNGEGLTPLTLACKLGRAEVFKEMLELSAREFWRYSNITCSAYPLNALDTLLPDGRTNWNSALFIILNGTKEEHLDMLDGGIIQRLLEEKWKTFARNQFLKRLLILFIHLVLLSCGVYLRPGAEAPLLGAPQGARDVLRYLCEIGTLLGVLSYVILQQGDELKNQGLSAFVKQLGHAPAKAIFLVSNFLLLACIPCRLAGHKTAEEAILVFAVPGSWFLLMFFAGAVRLTGPFVTMIYSMITGDMLTFGIIYSIVLFGFSQSFYFLYKGFPNVKSSLFASYPSTWMALLQVTLGDYSYSDLGQTTYPNLAKSVFALFMVFVPILLLNMLIAMMGNTYAHVIEQSEKEWMKQWAKIVVTLERAVPAAAAHHYLQEYSLGLGPSDDPRYEQRAVMVIKSKAKTRAKQRKGAVSNWKRVGKVTIAELRRRGITGEELRRIMWGRASISTPTKIPIKSPAPLLGPSGPDLAGGFGTALTSALDVISFTHDLDISTASNGLNLQSGHLMKPAVQPSTLLVPPSSAGVGALTPAPGALGATATGIDAAGSITSMLHQYSEAQGPADLRPTTSIAGGLRQTLQTQLSTNVSQIQQPPPHQTPQPTQLQVPMRPTIEIQQPTSPPLKTYPDQLRDLILLSMRKDSSDHSEAIKLLAKEAANLDHVEEVTIVVKPLPIGSARGPTVAGALSGLFGVETNVSTVSWNREKEKAPKHLEPSDSEGFGEAPLLGRVSRRRRARSATHHIGLDGASGRVWGGVSGSSSDAAPEPPGGAVQEHGDLDYAAARIQQLSNSAMHIYRYPKQQSTSGTTEATSVALRAARPRIIDRAALNVEPLVADHAGLIRGEGSGVEPQSGNRPHKERRKLRRPQTAKTNRVSPAARVSGSHRGASARDPLAAWSTAALQPMPRLLPECSSPSPSPSEATLELE